MSFPRTTADNLPEAPAVNGEMMKMILRSYSNSCTTDEPVRYTYQCHQTLSNVETHCEVFAETIDRLTGMVTDLERQQLQQQDLLQQTTATMLQLSQLVKQQGLSLECLGQVVKKKDELDTARESEREIERMRRRAHLKVPVRYKSVKK
jgi:hypothetical protein